MTIPTPRPRAPKARKSWAGLSKGKFLLDSEERVWEVASCDEQGATLILLDGEGVHQGEHRLEDRGWAADAYWKKLTAREVKKRVRPAS